MAILSSIELGFDINTAINLVMLATTVALYYKVSNVDAKNGDQDTKLATLMEDIKKLMSFLGK